MIDQAVTGYSKEMSLSQSVREHALLRMIEESLYQHSAIESSSLDRYCIEGQTRPEGSFVTFGDLKRGVSKVSTQVYPLRPLTAPARSTLPL